MTAPQQMMPLWWRVRAAWYFMTRGGTGLRTAWSLAKTFQPGDDRAPAEAVGEEMSYWGDEA